MDLSGFAGAESDGSAIDLPGASTSIESIRTLKSSQLSALESLASLLLREVELLKQNEERAVSVIENGSGMSLYDQVQQFEASMIRSALIRAGGVQKKAAELLGLKVSTLNVKIKRYKITFDLSGRED